MDTLSDPVVNRSPTEPRPAAPPAAARLVSQPRRDVLPTTGRQQSPLAPSMTQRYPPRRAPEMDDEDPLAQARYALQRCYGRPLRPSEQSEEDGLEEDGEKIAQRVAEAVSAAGGEEEFAADLTRQFFQHLSGAEPGTIVDGPHQQLVAEMFGDVANIINLDRDLPGVDLDAMLNSDSPQRCSPARTPQPARSVLAADTPHIGMPPVRSCTAPDAPVAEPESAPTPPDRVEPRAAPEATTPPTAASAAAPAATHDPFAQQRAARWKVMEYSDSEESDG
eukprot:NODE_2626_length_1023_cov_50.522321_g2607_i0.p1 GENE.NODE_2626_length_1023_cov_50.522321_g2607_i0~~NODE_2626_length_1023_cov_50.522321_g2607_i0.p1  ORF type:complete len:314 (-),score=52.95 NODE_2626_length_1023_cov_50.522321_g2607_i0:81-914(-)